MITNKVKKEKMNTFMKKISKKKNCFCSMMPISFLIPCFNFFITILKQGFCPMVTTDFYLKIFNSNLCDQDLPIPAKKGIWAFSFTKSRSKTAVVQMQLLFI